MPKGTGLPETGLVSDTSATSLASLAICGTGGPTSGGLLRRDPVAAINRPWGPDAGTPGGSSRFARRLQRRSPPGDELSSDRITPRMLGNRSIMSCTKSSFTASGSTTINLRPIANRDASTYSEPRQAVPALHHGSGARRARAPQAAVWRPGGCAALTAQPRSRYSAHTDGPIVYRLGRGPFKAERRVRLPLGLPTHPSRRANPRHSL